MGNLRSKEIVNFLSLDWKTWAEKWTWIKIKEETVREIGRRENMKNGLCQANMDDLRRTDRWKSYRYDSWNSCAWSST